MELSKILTYTINVPTLYQLDEFGQAVLNYDFMFDFEYNTSRIISSASLIARINEVDMSELSEDHKKMVNDLRGILITLPMDCYIAFNPLSHSAPV